MEVSKTPSFIASKPYGNASYSIALLQLGSTVLLYFGVIGLMFACLPIHYGLTLALSLLASALYLRLFMIGHDCGHGSYLPKKWQNDWLGNLIGVLVNTPLQYWARQHARHHQTTGNLDRRGEGDVITRTVEEFTRSSRFQQICYRIYRNPFFMLLVAAPVHFVLLQRLPLGRQLRTRLGWVSVMGTNAGIFIYYGAMILVFGGTPFLMVMGPVVLFSSASAVWLFYVQHQFDNAYWARNHVWTYHDATLQGSSFYDLPVWLHWVSGNIGYHHIHHLNPRIPNYRLPVCYGDNPVLQQARNLGLFESLGTARLALWDEEEKRLISFAELASR